MSAKIQNIIYAAILLIAFNTTLNAQSTRSLVNEGVDLYKKGKMNDAEVNFKKGVSKSPKNLQANFNLGDAYYKNKRFKEAINAFNKALLTSKDKIFKSKVYHNIGNSYLKQKKLKESIEAYKNALKLNPNDKETKYNLSYALQQMKNNKSKKNKNDKNNKNKDKNKKDKKKKNDKNKDKDQQNKDQKNNQDKKSNPKQNPAQQKKNKISKEQAKQILNALMNNEKKLQKKLRKRKAKVVKTEKDW